MVTIVERAVKRSETRFNIHNRQSKTASSKLLCDRERSGKLHKMQRHQSWTMLSTGKILGAMPLIQMSTHRALTNEMVDYRHYRQLIIQQILDLAGEDERSILQGRGIGDAVGEGRTRMGWREPEGGGVG